MMVYLKFQERKSYARSASEGFFFCQSGHEDCLKNSCASAKPLSGRRFYTKIVE